jgi:hypothetical protein
MKSYFIYEKPFIKLIKKKIKFLLANKIANGVRKIAYGSVHNFNDQELCGFGSG